MSEEKSSSEQMILQNKYDNKKQWGKELSEMTVQVDNLKRVIEMNDRQRTLLKENSKIATEKGNFIILNPTWQFEKDEKYLNNLKELNDISAALKDMEIDIALKQRDADMQRITKQRDDLQEAYNDLCKEIERLEKKGE